MKIKNLLITLILMLISFKTNSMLPNQLTYKLIGTFTCAKELHGNKTIILGTLRETNDLFMYRGNGGLGFDEEFAYCGCLIFADSRYKSLYPQTLKFQKNGKIVVTYLSDDNHEVIHRFHRDGTFDPSFEPQHAPFFTIKN